MHPTDYIQRVCRAMNYISSNLNKDPSLEEIAEAACVGVPEGVTPPAPLGLQTIEGGPYALCRFEVTCDGFKAAWEDAFRWLMNSGYECANLPCFELYHNNAEEHPEKKWIVDICIPVTEGR